MSEKKSIEINAPELAKKFREKFPKDPARFDSLPGTTPRMSSWKLVRLFEMAFDPEGRYTHDDIADELDYERSTITKKINAVDWDEFAQKLYRLCSMAHKEYIEAAADDHRTRALAKVALKTRRKEIDIRAQIKNFETLLLEGTAPQPKIKIPPIKASNKQRDSRTPEYMVLLLSDLHVGLGFDDDDTGGLGKFDHELLISRAKNLAQGLVEIYRLHSELYRIPKLYVFGLGDNIQGGNDIGQWGSAYNTMPLDMQVIEAGDIISQLLSTWSNVFDEINFIGVGGNHGRMEKKNVSKVRANHDNIVHYIVKARMSEHDNVNVDYKPAWWAMQDVNNTRFCLVHGDNMRSTINSLISEEQRIQSLISGVEDPFKILVAGHFHTHHELETSRGRIILNGSFVGGDVHSMKALKVRSRPTQTVMGVHPENGVTWKYCLDLDHPRKKHV